MALLQGSANQEDASGHTCQLSCPVWVAEPSTRRGQRSRRLRLQSLFREVQVAPLAPVQDVATMHLNTVPAGHRLPSLNRSNAPKLTQLRWLNKFEASWKKLMLRAIRVDVCKAASVFSRSPSQYGGSKQTPDQSSF